MVKVQRLPNGQLIITIPKKIAEYEGIKKGTKVDFTKGREGIVLKCK
jgi:AbrB family looped-hinge helix DNA binding protein